jgi:hypothetical protein
MRDQCCHKTISKNDIEDGKVHAKVEKDSTKLQAAVEDQQECSRVQTHKPRERKLTTCIFNKRVKNSTSAPYNTWDKITFPS